MDTILGLPIKGPFGDRLYCAYCDTLEGPFVLIGGRLVCGDESCRDRANASVKRERAARTGKRVGDLR